MAGTGMTHSRFSQLMYKYNVSNQNDVDELYYAIFDGRNYGPNNNQNGPGNNNNRYAPQNGNDGGGGGGGGRDRGGNPFTDMLNSFERQLQKIKGTINTIFGPWISIDRAASSFARSVGLSRSGLAQLRTESMALASSRAFGAKYGLSAEEVIGQIQNVNDAIGRNASLTFDDQERMVASGKIIGEGNVAEMMKNLDSFGMAMDKVDKYTTSMYKTSAKFGLNLKTLTKNFITNMKTAQQFTFKDGVDGIERMAKKASELKYSMQSVASFAKQVGSVEGAIQTSAKLQVLGGPFAAFSNPLEMLGESMTDMEGLYDRMTNMFNGLGRYNQQTHQVEVSAFDKQRIRAAANAMGVDYGEIMEGIHNAGRRQEISRQIETQNPGLDEDLKKMLLNAATINEKGEAVIKDRNGKEKSVADITAADEEHLISLNSSEAENVVQISNYTRDIHTVLTGIQKDLNALQAKWTNPFATRLKNVADENVVPNITGVEKAMLTGKAIKGGMEMLAGDGNTSKVGLALAGLNLVGGIDNIIKLRSNGGSEEDVNKAITNLLGSSIGAIIGARNGGSLTTVAGMLGGGAFGNIIGDGLNSYNFANGLSGQGPRSFFNGYWAQPFMPEANNIPEFLRAGKNTIENNTNLLQFLPQAQNMWSGIREQFNFGNGGELPENIYNNFTNSRNYRQNNFGDGGRINEIEKTSLVNNSSYNTNYNKNNFEKGDILPNGIGLVSTNSSTANKFNTTEQIINGLLYSRDVLNYIRNNSEFDPKTFENILGTSSGGLLTGPSHKEGGMRIGSTNMYVEGGEYVVNKYMTKEYLPVIQSINNGTFKERMLKTFLSIHDETTREYLASMTNKNSSGDSITPYNTDTRNTEYGKGGTIGNDIIQPKQGFFAGPIEIKQDTRKESAQNNGSNVSKTEKIEVSFSGSIKLDTGYGKNIDIMGKLLDDPVFIRKISELIGAEMSFTKNNSIVKDS